MNEGSAFRAFLEYWGKARPRPDAAHPWHPLAFHSLDVAACAMAILEGHDVLRERIDRVAGVPISELVPLIAALHDLGKFFRDFQHLAPEAAKALRPGEAPVPMGGHRPHADWGVVIWLAVSEILGIEGGKAKRRLRVLLGASFGHHGAPPNASEPKLIRERHSTPADRQAAAEFTAAMMGLLAPDWTLDDPRLAAIGGEACARVSFLLAALVNVADWIGSDQERFPYTPPDAMDLGAYWQKALRQARAAVAESGVVPRPPAPAPRFSSLFPEIAAPRPLQRLTETLALPAGQVLAVVEDATGSGKTEAADLLAARLMEGGRASGVFFAMPTMVTADAMARRHVDTYRRLFADGAPPSLALVHGGVDEAARDQLDQGGAECRAWLDGDRRLQLTAEVAVGTVDQALLAAMPSRFAAVRLFGLATKVLVVDEVHCHDAYTGTLLDGLLRLHAALGGSAVLLSATLSTARLRALVAAFASGAGWKAMPGAERIPGRDFPCLTLASASGVEVVEVPAHAGPRALPVAIEPSAERVARHLLDGVGAGGCGAWMRGTVDDAVAAYRELRAAHGDVLLLHSRFPRARRRELEALVIERFGPDSTPEGRRGGLVVGTQVLEQSLDLDFDRMAVDLKPMDALVQSAGRLRRHLRDREGRRIDGTMDGREGTALLVHGPDPGTGLDGDWFRRHFPGAAAVYPRADRLWLTAELLRLAGAIHQPEGLRALIEGVFGDPPALPVPEALADASLRAEAEAMAESAMARAGTLLPGIGYSREQDAWGDDRAIATRLGDAVELCLVRRDETGRGAMPWREAEGWGSGDLRLRTSLVAPLLPAIEADPAVVALRDGPTTRLLFRHRLPLPLSPDPDDRTIWRFAPAGITGPRLAYSDEIGLVTER